MGQRPRVQARVQEDLKEQIGEYADRHDVAESEALRQLTSRQLAAEGYQIGVTDGGATVTDRLEKIESRQQRSSTTHTATLVVGVAYVAVTVATGASGVLWGALGVGALLAVVLATAARNKERGGE